MESVFLFSNCYSHYKYGYRVCPREISSRPTGINNSFDLRSNEKRLLRSNLVFAHISNTTKSPFSQQRSNKEVVGSRPNETLG